MSSRHHSNAPRFGTLGASVRNTVTALAIGIAAISHASFAKAAEVQIIESGSKDRVMFLLQGEIFGGELQKLQSMVDRQPAGKKLSIFLNSPGGNLGEGLRLGAYFHLKRIATLVKGSGGVCASACALAFLGGRDSTGKPLRVKLSGGKLGFHQFRTASYDPLKIYTKADFELQVARAQNITREVVLYLKMIGDDLSKLKLMLRAPSEGMYFVPDKEALTIGMHVLDEASGQLIAPTEAVPQKAGS
jgi:hypothetical protein